MRILNKTYEEAPVDLLRPHPRNPNRGVTPQIEGSIEATGFYGAVVAQTGTRYVLAGNHTLEAAINQGAEKVPTIWVDCDDETALRVLSSSNRIAELAERDDTLLASLLSDLSDTDGGLLGTGYDDDFLSSLLGTPDPPPPDPLPPPDPPPPTTAPCKGTVQITVTCSRADLADFSASLDEWERREGVTVAISS